MSDDECIVTRREFDLFKELMDERKEAIGMALIKAESGAKSHASGQMWLIGFVISVVNIGIAIVGAFHK